MALRINNSLADSLELVDNIFLKTNVWLLNREITAAAWQRSSGSDAGM